VTKEQVVEYDNLGVLKWESGEIRTFAFGNLSYQTSAQQVETPQKVSTDSSANSEASFTTTYHLLPIAYSGAMVLIGAGAYFAFFAAPNASFGADAYTYTYRGIRSIVQALGWLMMCNGAIALGVLSKVFGGNKQ
jgi:hypothetical protein